MKTTAPKHYCVQPNRGVLNVGEEASVSGNDSPVFVWCFLLSWNTVFQVLKSNTLLIVRLQPIDLSLTGPERIKHKFMVQTMFAPLDFMPEQLDAAVS